MSETFIGPYKKGDMFQHEGNWYIAEEDGVYQDAGEAEEGFDVFLPHSDYYTPCRKATETEVQAHLDQIAEKRASEIAVVAQFQIGQRVRRKKPVSGKVATILEIDVEKGCFRYLFDGARSDGWTRAIEFEAAE